MQPIYPDQVKALHKRTINEVEAHEVGKKLMGASVEGSTSPKRRVLAGHDGTGIATEPTHERERQIHKHERFDTQRAMAAWTSTSPSARAPVAVH